MWCPWLSIFNSVVYCQNSCYQEYWCNKNRRNVFVCELYRHRYFLWHSTPPSGKTGHHVTLKLSTEVYLYMSYIIAMHHYIQMSVVCELYRHRYFLWHSTPPSGKTRHHMTLKLSMEMYLYITYIIATHHHSQMSVVCELYAKNPFYTLFTATKMAANWILCIQSIQIFQDTFI